MKVKKLLALVLALAVLFSGFNYYHADPVVKADEIGDDVNNGDTDELGEAVEVDTDSPKIQSVTEKNGKITIRFTKFEGATTYQIYRAHSRYGEYKAIDMIDQPTGSYVEYVDENPNPESKYSNYYKVKANGTNANDLSLPGSLEITEFGFNTYMFDERDDNEKVDELLYRVYQKQRHQQFGKDRFQIFFKPDTDGEKDSDYGTGKKVGDFNDLSVIRCGYNTAIGGLGETPYDVELNNVWCPAALSKANATCNFWSAIENLTISKDRQDLDGHEQILRDTIGSGWEENINNVLPDFLETKFLWSVSQAAPARRLVVERPAQFDWKYGWASGGYFADTIFQDEAGSYSQQQYYYRNCDFQGTQTDLSIYGVNWNQVIQGCKGVRPDVNTDNSGNTFDKGYRLQSDLGYTNWPSRGCTTVLDESDSVREKPFLYFDSKSDEYKVFVPKVRKKSQGVSYTPTDMGNGYSLSLDKFYIAKPTDTAKQINDKLGRGYNLIFQPGIYYLEEALDIYYENTIVLGLGLATLTATDSNKESIFKICGKKIDAKTGEDLGKIDVGGVQIASLLMDAGKHTDTMVEVGYEGANVDHSNNPCALHDLTIRVGGTGRLGTTDSAVVVNSNNTVIDQTWIWRADHGDHTGWSENLAKNGIVVNGDDVTCYGLFVEHFQEYDILWRGENGRTYFLQNEKCYDPQDQRTWMSHNGTKEGFAAYKVANNVKKHYAVGLGIYDVFINTNGASIHLDSAIEVPDTPGVLIENACIVEIASADGPAVGINSLINNAECWPIRTGAPVAENGELNGGYAIQRLLSYTTGNATALPDYYMMNDPIYGDKFDNNGLITNTVEKHGSTPTNDSFADKDIKKEAKTYDDSVPLDNMNDAAYDKKIKEKTRLWELYQKWLASDPGDKKNIETKPSTEAPGPIKNVKVGKAKIAKLTKKKRSSKVLKVKMKKLKNITGFRIAVFKSKKNAKKYKKKKKKKLVLSIKNYKFKKKLTFKVSNKKLKKKKKLFVMVRGYKKIDSRTTWGAWSAIKTKKIKKK